ncbi:conjugal transfer protein TraG [Cronobacter dublinensis subsp. dublinensis]|nr:conjugal transfer protein TraG [Cronobacter dublinensis subsp. dublinensis]EGT5729868.1 conjugal transfer protein TraG [Cronobacter dublinensis subsp. dublinensis]
MSEWNVYTVGSVDFLYNVFNAIAMLFNHGTYSDTFRISALLGVIGIVIASAISGAKTLSFGQMAVCVVMYMLFFQVSARVNLEDMTTGEYRAIDNVPWGLAAPASVISTVGYAVTENIEQAFSTPSMTEYGALDPLFSLAAYYDTLKEPMRWSLSAAGSSNADIAGSIDSYVRTCVANDIARDANTYAHIWRSNSGVDSVASNDASTYVVIYDGKGSNGPPVNPRNASQYTCAEAYTKLKDQASGSVSTLNNSFARVLGQYGRCNDCTASQKVTEMMNFYNISSSNIRDFQLQMMMMPNLINLPKDANMDAFKSNAAIARAQTQTQQAFQWASGGSSFLYWMSSFMPIFQGVIYSLAPFMAFLLGLGVMGLRLIMKYFLIVVWTQTWVPLAAVINLYVLTKMQSTTEAISNMTASASTLPFNQIYDIIIATQKNIALAGNLFGLIPALAGFIVWGSSIAFNSLAQSAAAPSPADTKVLAPDVTNAPALNNRSAEFSYNPMSGTTVTGASGVVGGISMGEMAQSSKTSARNELQSATVQEQAARSQAIQALSANKQGGVHSQAQNQAIESALQNRLGSQYSVVDDFKKRTGGDATDFLNYTNALALQGGADASAGVGAEGGPKVPGAGGATAKAQAGVSASASGSSITTDSHGNSISSGEAGSSGDAAQLSKGIDSSLNQKIGSAVNDVMSRSSEFGISSSSGSNYTQAYSHLQTASKQYSEAEAFSQSSAVNQTMSFDVLGQKANDVQGLDQKITQIGSGIEGFAQRRDQYQHQMMGNGMTQENAYAAASIMALKDSGQLHQIAGDLGFLAGGGSPEINNGAASQNAGVSGNANTAVQHVNSIGNETAAGVASSESQAQSGVAGAGAISNPGTVRGRVEDNFNDNSSLAGPVRADHNDNRNQVEYEQSRSAFSHVSTYQPQNVARDGLKIVNDLSSRLNSDNPTIQHERKAAHAVATENGNSYGAHALADFYAAGKSGMSGDQLNSFRENAMASIMADTGGTRAADGTVSGGNKEYAERAVAAIESTFERQGANDINTLNMATKGLWAAKNESMPSNETDFRSSATLTGPRSNGDNW